MLQNGNLQKLPDCLPFLVVSDLDGTMVGNNKATAAFKVYIGALALTLRLSSMWIYFCMSAELLGVRAPRPRLHACV